MMHVRKIVSSFSMPVPRFYTLNSKVGVISLIPIRFKPPPFSFTPAAIGRSNLSGLIGALVGEVFAGPLLDYLAKRTAKLGKEWYPERRLVIIYPGLATVVVGVSFSVFFFPSGPG
jgi:fructose-specific phosphotransferase system IIC component